MPRIKRRISRKSLKRNYNKFKKFKKYLKSRKNIKKLKGGSVPEFNSSNIDNLVILKLTKINTSITESGISFKAVNLFDTSKQENVKFTLLGNINTDIVSVECNDRDYMILLTINYINPIIHKIEIIYDNSNKVEYSTYKLVEVFSYVFKHKEQLQQYLNSGVINSNLTAEQKENIKIFIKIKTAINIQIYL